MATKVAAAPYVEPPSTDVVLSIEGLVYQADGTFVLRDVNPLNMDFSIVENMLLQAGVGHMDAVDLTEDFEDRVFKHQLAIVLAQRTKRVDTLTDGRWVKTAG